MNKILAALGIGGGNLFQQITAIMNIIQALISAVSHFNERLAALEAKPADPASPQPTPPASPVPAGSSPAAAAATSEAAKAQAADLNAMLDEATELAKTPYGPASF